MVIRFRVHSLLDMDHGNLLLYRNYRLLHLPCHQTPAQNINEYDCRPSFGCNRSPENGKREENKKKFINFKFLFSINLLIINDFLP